MATKTPAHVIKLIEKAAEEKAEFLDLGNCGLSSIPPEIIMLKMHLRSLNLSPVYLTEFEKFTEFMSSTDYFEHNSFSLDSKSTWLPFSEFPYLNSLGLYHTGITDSLLVAIEGAFPNVKQIDLSNNAISAVGLRSFERYEKLTALDFSMNIIDIQGALALSKLKGLMFLNISGTKIGTKGAQHISNLLKLKSLTTSGNEIDSVGLTYFTKLSNLSRLDVSSNQISEKIGKVIARLPLPNLTIKLMVNGNGNSGKSTLIHALKEGYCNEVKSSTHGIIIDIWKWIEANKEINFHIWDFGGQEIFHGTHRLFMQSEAVWLSVFDPETERFARLKVKIADRDTGEPVLHHVLQFWLDEAEDSAGNQIVVQTKKALNPDKDEFNYHLAQGLRAEFVQVDSTSGLGIPWLRSVLHAKGMELREYGMPMPPKWMEIREFYLDNLKKATEETEKIIDISEFNRRCIMNFQIPESVIPTLLRFLHHSGVIYFNEHFLKGTIITDQRWALDAIYKPLKRNSDFYNKLRNDWAGRVREESIFAAFGEDYTVPHKNLFLELMQSCGLCFRLSEGQETHNAAWYVFPEYLPEDVPFSVDDIWKAVDPKTRIFRLNLPYFNYFRIQKFIAALGQNTRKEYMWRNGIMVQTSDGLFRVEADYEKQAIVIKIERKAVNQWLERIIKEIGDTKGAYEGNWVEILNNGSEAKMDLDKLLIAKRGGDRNSSAQNNSLSEQLPKVVQEPPKILVVSYAKEDRDFVQALRKQLIGLKNEGKIVLWFDQKLDGREYFDEKIKDIFEKADGFVVFIGPDYVDDEVKAYIHQQEIPIMVRRKKQDKIPVYCITTTPVDYGQILGTFDPFDDKKPIPRDELKQGEFLHRFVNDVIRKKFLKI